MSIPVSAVPNVIQYLTTQIQAQLTNSSETSVRLNVGELGDEWPNDVIQIGGVRRRLRIDTFIGGGGTDWLNESFDIEGYTWSWTGSDSDARDTTYQNAVIARAWQLLGYVETAVRNDPGLGGLVDVCNPGTSTSVGPEVAENGGLVCEVHFTLHIDHLN